MCLSAAVTLKPQIQDECELLGLPSWRFSYLVVKTGGKSESWSFPPSTCMLFPDYMHSCLPRCCVSKWGEKNVRYNPISRGRTWVRVSGKSSPTMLFVGHGSGMRQLWNSSCGRFYLWLLEWHTFSAKTGTHYAVGKVSFPWWLENRGLLFWKSRAHPHSTQTMRVRPGVGPRFSMNRTESLRPASHLQRNPGSHSPGKEMPYLPLGSGDRDSLLSSSTLPDQTSCVT